MDHPAVGIECLAHNKLPVVQFPSFLQPRAKMFGDLWDKVMLRTVNSVCVGM